MKSVIEQYLKDKKEHERMLKNDPYYAHCHGGGIVPEPRCEHCLEYLPGVGRCTKEWNNLDQKYYLPDRDDRMPDDCCESYQWDGEFEEE